MLKVLCFCIPLLFYTLQVKSLGDVKAVADAHDTSKAPVSPKAPSAPKVPAAPKAPSVPKSLAPPKEPSAPKVPALKTGQPNVDANMDLNVEASADVQGGINAPPAPKVPSTPKAPATWNPGQSTVDTNVDFNGKADVHVQEDTPKTPVPPKKKSVPKSLDAPKKTSTPKGPPAPKVPSTPKAPAILNSGQSTVDENVEFNEKTDVDDQDTKEPVAPKEPSDPKSFDAPKEPSTPEAPATLNPDQSTVDTNVNFNGKADVDVQDTKEPVASKEPSTPEAPATLNPDQSTVDTNVDFNGKADVDVQDTKEPVAPKEPSDPKSFDAPKELSTPEAPATLNPDQSTVDTNVDFNGKADVDVQDTKEPVASKEPSTPEAPATLSPGQSTVDANVEFNEKTDVDVQDTKEPVAPKEPSDPKSFDAPKEPSTPEAPATLNPGQSTVDTNVDFNVTADVDLQDTPEEPVAPKEPSTPTVPATLNPDQSILDANMDFNEEAAADVQGCFRLPADPKVPSVPKTPPAPKSQKSSCLEPWWYCWEAYDGTVPPNALLASDDPEKKVYVGMVTIGFPDYTANCTGTLIENRVEMISECYGKQKVTSRLKILTVKDKSQFQWVKTSKGTFSKDLKDKGEPFKFGKSEHNVDWFVGRVTTEDGTTEIGHVSAGVIYFIHNNDKLSQARDYEVLVELIPGQSTVDENVDSNEETAAEVQDPSQALSAPKSQKSSCLEPWWYCWEAYDGTVPPNALLASDDPEKKVYVGMVTMPYKAFTVNCTGTLIENRVEMISECYGKPKVTRNLKILTVKDKSQFQWVKTSKGTFSKDLKDKGEPFKFGTNKDKNSDWFVGRVTTEDGTTEIGHISAEVIYFIHNNHKLTQARDYEVLVELNEKESTN